MEKDFPQDEEKSLTPQQPAEPGDSSQAQNDIPETAPTTQPVNLADEPTVRPAPPVQPTTPVDVPTAQSPKPVEAPFHNDQTVSVTQPNVPAAPMPTEDTLVLNHVTRSFPPSQPNHVPEPSQPLNPNYQPNYNPYPYTQQQANTSNPNYAPRPQRSPKPPKQPGKLAQPLPMWALLGSIALVIVLLVILHLTGSDWAAGALHASSATLFIGVALVIVFIVRSLDGLNSALNPTRTRQQAITITCILLLFIYSFVAQALQPMLHATQGQALENQQQWQSAISEYTQGGEQAPYSVDLARTYTSWGLALNKQAHYGDASQKFLTVITQFDSPETLAELKRAEDGDINARLGLAQQFMQVQNYLQARSTYDTILQLAYCEAACTTKVSNLDATAYTNLGQTYVQKKDYQSAVDAFDTVIKNFTASPDIAHVRALDATAYYNLGQNQLQDKNYSKAVTSFDALKDNFPNAPEVKQAHGPMSQSLLGYGQQTRASNCQDAIPIYQRLAKDYGDTSGGKTAESALSAPQNVTGHFTNTEPNIPFNQIALATGLSGIIVVKGTTLFDNWDNASMKTDIASNGDFTFTGVSQGNYDLLWYANDGTYEHVEFIYDKRTGAPIYVATVGPLCSVNVGDVSNSESSDIS